MHLTCTSGSVGAPGSNPWGDPAMTGVTYRDEIVIFRVVASNQRTARRFFRQLKDELKRALRQEEILIIERDVEAL